MMTNERVMDGFVGSQLCPACSKLTPYVANQEEWHQNRCGLKSPENLSRIHIIGGPGSGKTTLARKIGTYLGIETDELDQVAFTGRDYIERPFSDRVADITRIASRPAWITEGLFVQWTDELLVRAKMIVWLDHVDWEKGIVRITHRYIRSAIHEAKRRRGLQRFIRFHDYARHVKQFVQVVLSSRAYYTGESSRSTGRTESRLSTAAYLNSYKDKVIHCYSDDAVKAFIDYIHLCHEDCGSGHNL